MGENGAGIGQSASDVAVPAQISPVDKSIAVLPFVDMSAEGDQEYMSDGIAEEVLNLLAKIPELRVISRSSAFAFKGKDIDIPTVAEQLGVSYVLEGSVRKDGSHIRITAQLIEAGTDSHLWSENYDRELDNIFQIQDEIAESVVQELKINLLGAVPEVTRVNQDAYVLALQGKFYWNRRAPGDEERALELYQQALDIDPDYAYAWTGLSVALAVQAFKGNIPREEGLPRARAAADKALELDPDLADAHVRMGQALAREGDFVSMRRAYERALELEPNSALTLGVMARALRSEGRIEEAIEVQKKAVTVDPMSAITLQNLGGLLIGAGRFDEAEAVILKVRDLFPESMTHLRSFAMIAWQRGEYEQALEWMENMRGEPETYLLRCVIFHALGDIERSNADLERFREATNDNQYGMAEAHTGRGEIDLAFTLLNQLLDTDPIPIGALIYNPYFWSLQDDPRWDQIIERTWKPDDTPE